jgi:Cytidine and deoxycytidylate deaminase zinc-binding region.
LKNWVAAVAIKAARESLFEPNKHAAVLESGGSILAIACNSPKASNPQTSCSIHAEVAAIKKLGIRAKPRCDLYVARVNKGKVGLSRPCPKCMEILEKNDWINRVYYSKNEIAWGEIFADEPIHYLSLDRI